jgi:A/G-specific adenine glycosylase
MEGRERRIATLLLAWYDEHKRELPWRKAGRADPYAVWVSEIILQQTRVETAGPYFERFMARFPDVHALAGADLQEVLKAWENLGYYSRARNLHRAAQAVIRDHGGRLPEDREALLALPGIGPYTAGAILSLAFGRPEAAVDGNVRRVLCRLEDIRDPLERAATLEAVEARASALVPAERPGAFNQALMDLGSGICTPKGPRCLLCPLLKECEATRQGDPEALPVKKKRRPVPHRSAAGAVIRDGQGRVLLVKRPDHGLLGGLWKLPGGEVEEGENPARALERQVAAEAGLAVEAEPTCLASVNHTYTHFTLTFQAYACRWTGGRPEARTCDAWAWTALTDLDRFPLSGVDAKLLKKL